MRSKIHSPLPAWHAVPGYRDVLYEKADEGIAKDHDQPSRGTQRLSSETVQELQRAFTDARDDEGIGVVS